MLITTFKHLLVVSSADPGQQERLRMFVYCVFHPCIFLISKNFLNKQGL